MVGDSIDNIPGIKGVGDKTARALLAEHGSLEVIYEHLDEMKPGLRKKLEEGRERAFSSRDLTRLRLDEPLGEDDLQRGQMKRKELAALLGRYAMKNLAQRLLGNAAQAEELYKAALNGGADANIALTRLGIAQYDQGKYAEAKANFEKVAGIRQPIARLWLALIASKAGTAS